MRPRTLLACRDGILARAASQVPGAAPEEDAAPVELVKQVGHFAGDPADKREVRLDEYADGEYLLPKFAGAQGNIIRKSLREMEDSFARTLRQVR